MKVFKDFSGFYLGFLVLGEVVDDDHEKTYAHTKIVPRPHPFGWKMHSFGGKCTLLTKISLFREKQTFHRRET